MRPGCISPSSAKKTLCLVRCTPKAVGCFFYACFGSVAVTVWVSRPTVRPWCSWLNKAGTTSHRNTRLITIRHPIYCSCWPGVIPVGTKKAGRPVSRPENRIRQAAHLLVFLQTHGMGWFLGQTLTACVAEFGCKPFSAGQRGRVLIHTVLLPALHILGSLVHKTELTTQAEACWINGRVPVPSRIERVFRKAGGAMQLLHNHPGTLPLYRYQCSQGGCASCRIF